MTIPPLDRRMTGEPPTDYVKALSACQSVTDLRALVTVYRELALDAVPIVDAMTAADWPEFSRGLKLERRGRFAGEPWAAKYAAVLMPAPMFQIAAIADEYKVPFGLAWQRCRDVRPDLLTVQAKP